MTFEEDSLSLVIVGKWNLGILTPEWVGSNIFKNNEIEVEFALNSFDDPMRFSHGDIRIVPSNSKVAFFPQKRDDQTLRKVEEMARTLAEILTYTPVNAYGINFSIVEKDPDTFLVGKFNLEDDVAFSDGGFRIKATQLNRSIELENGILNLKVSFQEDQVKFFFNFHYLVSNIKEVSDTVDGKFPECKKIVEKIMGDVYKLQIEGWEE